MKRVARKLHRHESAPANVRGCTLTKRFSREDAKQRAPHDPPTPSAFARSINRTPSVARNRVLFSQSPANRSRTARGKTSPRSGNYALADFLAQPPAFLPSPPVLLIRTLR